MKARTWQSRFACSLLITLCRSTPAASALPPDPTRPPDAVLAAESSGNGSLHVSAVMVNDHHAIAIIDGRPCRVGDRVGGLKVQAIDLGRVILQGVGGERMVPLGQGVESPTRPKAR
jgi:hypothetical protein